MSALDELLARYFGAMTSYYDDDLHKKASAELAALRARIAELEAEVEKLNRERSEETAEFNAGYEAAKRGEPDNEPSGCKYDVWSIGWAWGKHGELLTENARLRKHLETVRDEFMEERE